MKRKSSCLPKDGLKVKKRRKFQRMLEKTWAHKEIEWKIFDGAIVTKEKSRTG